MRHDPNAIVHAEIEYTREDGLGVHSDICPRECKFRNITPEYRAFLHASLDEWLDKSGGTGSFYISAEQDPSDDE
jgi:hypothetical protein